jgi:peptidoglycan/LPS O-acetylase OafA/YrhL
VGGTRTRLDIQGLRAVAVVLVVLAHVGVPGLPGGFIGVDVFFVVSGFLITGLLLREWEATGRIRLGAFFARRARRILPLATLVLVATAGYAAATLPASRVDELATDARWSALFLANVHFAQVDGDYFAQDRATSPVQHFWSLGVEEQFYLVWPALLVLVLVAAGLARRRAGTVPVAAVLVVIWCASYAWCVLESGRPAAYYGALPRAWELATGAVLALAVPLLLRLKGWARTVLAAAGVAAVGLTAARYDDGSAGPELLLPVAGAAALLAAGTVVHDARLPLACRPLTWPGMVRLGDRSYSLYLWHWPVVVLVIPALGLGAVTDAVVALAITACLAEVGFRLVETPFRRGRVPGFRGRPALSLWPVTVLLVGGSCLLAESWAAAGLEERRQESQRYYAEHPTAMAGPARQLAPQPVRAALAEAIRLADAGAPIPNELVNEKGLRNDHWQTWFDCYAGWDQVAVRLCPLGDRHAARTMVVHGDSQAGMLLPALDLVGRDSGLRVIALVKLGCAPYAVDQLHVAVGERYLACDHFREWAQARIRELKPDVLVLGARGMWAVDTTDGTPAQESWSTGVQTTLRELTARTDHVVVMAGLGALAVSPRDCLTDAQAVLATCTTPEDERILMANDLTRAAAARAGATYADLTTLACLRHRCPLVAERIVLYRDPAHLTKSWVRRVAWELAGLMKLT